MAELKKNFNLKFSHSIHHKLVSIGKYDGKNPCLTCGTTAGKVFVHNPYEKAKEGKDDDRITFLNINQKVTTLVSGKLNNDSTHDVLFVGTPTNLLAYDVLSNEDIFYREIPDGVKEMIIGKLGNIQNSQQLAFIGGNCSIIGLDERGGEAFWTVCGDNVGAMTLNTTQTIPSTTTSANAAGGGGGTFVNHLLVGSDDYGLRRYENEEQIWEVFESDSFVGLASLITPSTSTSERSAVPSFSYALSNGTVGVYDTNQSRIWRVKSKHECRSLLNWDATGDGVLDVVSGWSNGTVVIRRADNGQILFKQSSFSQSPVAGMVCADYRMVSTKSQTSLQLIVCHENGEVNGYDQTAEGLVPSALHAEKMNKLQAYKTSLLHELSVLKETMKVELVKEDKGRVDILQAKNGLELEITFNSFNIVQVIVFDLEAGMFSGPEGETSESLLIVPPQLKKSICIPIFPQKNIIANLSIQVLASPQSSGSANTANLHVFDLKTKLPKFATLYLTDQSGDFQSNDQVIANRKPLSCVSFKLPPKMEASGNSSLMELSDWIDENFMIQNKKTKDMLHSHRTPPPRPGRGSSAKLNLIFENVVTTIIKDNNDGSDHDRSPLWLEAEYTQEGDVRVNLRCNSFELASVLMVDICAALELKDLNSTCDFDQDMEELRSLMDQVAELNHLRQRLTIDAADGVNKVKGFVVKAEDARLMGDMSLLKRHYISLHGLNSELAMEYTKRSTNHEALLNALRQVNVFIERGSRLRLGVYRSGLVSQARAAMKARNASQLITVIQKGPSGIPSPSPH